MRIPPHGYVYGALASLFPSGSLRKRLAYGALWSFIGAAISQGLSLVSSVFCGRILGQEGFGRVGIVTSTIGMLATIGGIGLGSTGTKFVAEYRQSHPAKAGSVIGLTLAVGLFSALLMALVLYVTAPFLAQKTLNSPSLQLELRIAVLILFGGIVNGVQNGVLAGIEAFRTLAILGIVRGVLTLPIVVLGASLFGTGGAVAGMGVVAIVLAFISHPVLLNKSRSAGITIDYRGIFAERGVLWKYSFPALLAGAMTGPFTWVASAMLVNEPNGYAEMGLFNAASQFRTFVVFLPSVISQVLLPVLSNLYGNRQIRRFQRVLWKNVFGVGVVSLALALIMVALSKETMGVYGRGFDNGSRVLSILAITAVLSSTIGVIGYAISGMGRMWEGFVVNCIWALALMILAALLVHQGAEGLAWAYFGAYVVHLVSVLVLVRFLLARTDRISPMNLIDRGE